MEADLHALTDDLEAEVLPPLTASLRTPAGSLERAWPAARLEDLINELADPGRCCTSSCGGTATRRSISSSISTDPWPGQWRSRVKAHCSRWPSSFVGDLFASVVWIDQLDR